jgi:hypothetical protein
VSVWNRIGDVASNVGKFAGEIAGAGAGVARFAWDVGTAPWNDNEEYNGFVNTFKTAYNKESKNIVKPFASAGGAIMKVPGLAPTLRTINEINQEYIREPLTTVNLVAGDLYSGRISPLGIFDPDSWRKAYKGAQEISYGQSVVSAIRNIYDPKFNVYDPREREQAFKKSMFGKFASGIGDFGIQLVGDVTLVAGKAAKVATLSTKGIGAIRNADDAAKAAEDITRSQYGVKTRFTKVIDDFTKNDSMYALNHPMVKSSNNPGLLAHLLGDSVDADETALILRSALGDPKAMDELSLQRAYITDALRTAGNEMSAVEEFKLFAAPDESGMIPFLNENKAVIDEAEANYRSLAASDEYFANMMELTKGGGALSRTTGFGIQGIDDFVAKARTVKFYDRKVGNPQIDVYQPTPFHRLYQKVSWLAGERPAGIVNFNDPDSYREIVSTVNRLEKIIGIDEVQSKNLIDSYIKGSTPEQRFQAVMEIEGRAVRAIAAKHGIDEEVANTIYNNAKRARTSAMKSIQDKGYMVDFDGSIIRVPQFESQTADYLPVMDFDLLDRVLKRNKSQLRALVGRGAATTGYVLDTVQDMFKAGALLRLGYTQRNAIDSQLRIISSVGALAALRHLGPGVKNVVYNTVKTPGRIIDKYRPVDEGMTYGQIEAKIPSLVKEIEERSALINKLEGQAALRKNDPELAVEISTLKMLQEEKNAIYNHYQDVLAKNTKMDKKAKVGSGAYEVTASDGQTYILDDAFGGPIGEIFRRLASSQNSFERMVDTNTDLYAKTLASKGIGAVRPTDPAYFDQWAQTLRQYFGNSAVARKLADGESVEDVTTWLRNSPDGRDLRRRLAIPADGAAEYVTKTNGFLDHYLPASSGLRPKLREITAADLRTTFKDPTSLPIIHGHVLETNLKNSDVFSINAAVNGAFKLLASMPEDAWARHPLFVTLYRREAKRRLDVMTGLKKDRLSPKEQQELMNASRQTALRDMKKILFNIERKTNAATLMKYINPFFSAQENAYKTWMKFAVANPALINRGYLVWNAPNKAGIVTDEDGNVVPEGQTSGSDTIWLSLPSGVNKVPGFTDLNLTKLGIPKQSLDIIFQGGMDVLYSQGNPNMFGDLFPVGPYIAAPISEVVKRQPKLEDTFKWALPFGPSKDAVSALLPAWVQRQITKAGGQEDPQYGRIYQLIWNTEQQNAKFEGRKPLSNKKIEEMTNSYWNLRTWANLIAPFAPRFDSPYQFYIQKSREYRRLYGINADAQFLNDFPDYFSFTTSLSSNPTGVQSSKVAVQNIKKYGSLIEELASVEPKLIGMVVNDPTGYEFSDAAYSFLYGKRIAPGSATKFLSSQNPVDAQKKTDAEKGWIQYNKYMDIIDNELEDRVKSGRIQSPSTMAKGAEDLKALKEAIVRKLAVQTDADGRPIYDKKTGQYAQTAWYDDYLDSDGSKTNRVIVGLGKIINDSVFKKDRNKTTTFKSISAYLDYRKTIAAELAKREAKSITANSNKDLALLYDAIVNKLKSDDKLGFAYIYDRFLSQDLVYDKYLTPKEVK